MRYDIYIYIYIYVIRRLKVKLVIETSLYCTARKTSISISLSIMPCSTVSSLACSTRSPAYFTVRIPTFGQFGIGHIYNVITNMYLHCMCQHRQITLFSLILSFHLSRIPLNRFHLGEVNFCL